MNTKKVLVGSIALAIAVVTMNVCTTSKLTSNVHEDSITVTSNTNAYVEPKHTTSHTYYNSVASPINLSQPYTNGAVSIKINNQLTVTGKINVVTKHMSSVVPKEITRFGGELVSESGSVGSFVFAVADDTTTSGLIMFPRERVVYELQPTVAGGAVTFIKKNMADTLCIDLPPADIGGPLAEGGAIAEGAVTTGTVTTGSVTTSTVKTAIIPIFESRPTAKVVLYLDMRGSVVQDPLWYSGRTINADAPGLTDAQIKQVFDTVVQRYEGFNINITTSLESYINAPMGSRMRAVLTSNSWIAGYGGYAFINSLVNAGNGIYSPGIMCWVFTKALGNNPKYIAEATAHELGHTFGLRHDGSVSPKRTANGTYVNYLTTYYAGQGDWAPIMGVGYYKPVVQWSKGEYNYANNFLDEKAIIANTPGVGYINYTPTLKTATPLSGTVTATNTICQPDDIKYYVINTASGGSVNLTVSVPPYSGLNTVVEMYNASGVTLAKNNPDKNLNTYVSTNVGPGVYYIKVMGAGEGDPKSTGYSSYGSMGSFTISGTVPTGATTPVVAPALLPVTLKAVTNVGTLAASSALPIKK